MNFKNLLSNFQYQMPEIFKKIGVDRSGQHCGGERGSSERSGTVAGLFECSKAKTSVVGSGRGATALGVRRWNVLQIEAVNRVCLAD